MAYSFSIACQSKMEIICRKNFLVIIRLLSCLSFYRIYTMVFIWNFCHFLHRIQLKKKNLGKLLDQKLQTSTLVYRKKSYCNPPPPLKKICVKYSWSIQRSVDWGNFNSLYVILLILWWMVSLSTKSLHDTTKRVWILSYINWHCMLYSYFSIDNKNN